jgi:hypothetical protein
MSDELTKSNDGATASVSDGTANAGDVAFTLDGSTVGSALDGSKEPLTQEGLKPLNLQSPIIRTRSTKENAIDADLVNISNTLAEVSMGVFVDGTYERSYIEDATGEVVELRFLNVQNDLTSFSLSIGNYTLDQSLGQITTNGNGERLFLDIVISENGEFLFINLKESSILSGGENFNDGDSIFIKSIDLGGTDKEEVIEIVLQEGATFQGSERYAGIRVEPKTGVIIYGGLIIDTSTLPTEDPGIDGAVWVNTQNGNVLMVSIASTVKPFSEPE